MPDEGDARAGCSGDTIRLRFLVGSLVGGGVAVLVALGAQGWVAALILLAALVAETQLEAHVLQPLIVGRCVRLHPLLVGLALGVGAILGGIVGALIAVPTTAVLRHTVPQLLGREAATEDRPEGRDRAGGEVDAGAAGPTEWESLTSGAGGSDRDGTSRGRRPDR